MVLLPVPLPPSRQYSSPFRTVRFKSRTTSGSFFSYRNHTSRASMTTSEAASRYPPSCRVSSPLLPAASRFFIHPSSHSRPSRTVTGLKPSPESASKIRMGTGMARNISLSRIRAGSFAGSSNASIRPFSMTITRSA